MSEELEYRCFVGNLSWSTSDRSLKEAFDKFGRLLEAKVINEKDSGRSRGFGFVTFSEKQTMEKAIEAMNGIDLDGRNITVERASPNQGLGRDYESSRPRDYYSGRDHHREREIGRRPGGGGGGDGGGGGGGRGECFKCGRPGHFARECPDDGSSGGKYGARDDRYGGNGGNNRFGDNYGPDRNGRRNRDDRGRGGDRYGRDRVRPYDRRGAGDF